MLKNSFRETSVIRCRFLFMLFVSYCGYCYVSKIYTNLHLTFELCQIQNISFTKSNVQEFEYATNDYG